MKARVESVVMRGPVRDRLRAGWRGCFLWLLSLGLATSAVGDDGGSDARASIDSPQTWAVALPVSDVDAAQAFWAQAVRHRALEGEHLGTARLLALGELRLILYPDNRALGSHDENGFAPVYPNYEVSDLEAAGAKVVRHGGTSGPVEPNAIGLRVLGHDPSGNRFNLMTITGRSLDPEAGLQPFNVGLSVTMIEEAEALLEKLGQEVSSRSYLPETLPFAKRGRFPLVVHQLANGQESEGQRSSFLVFSVPDLDAEERRLDAEGVATRRKLAPWGMHDALVIESPAVSASPFLIVERTSDTP